MPRCHLNVENTCRYLQSVRLSQLDGLALALKERMEALELKPNRKAHKAFVTTPEQAPGGDMRGILRFIANATVEDAGTLQLLEAVVSARMRGAGYQQAQPVTEK